MIILEQASIIFHLVMATKITEIFGKYFTLSLLYNEPKSYQNPMFALLPPFIFYFYLIACDICSSPGL
jgi:hypothetical protein